MQSDIDGERFETVSTSTLNRTWTSVAHLEVMHIVIAVGSSTFTKGESSSRVAHHTTSPKKITTAAVATRSTFISFNVDALLL